MCLCKVAIDTPHHIASDTEGVCIKNEMRLESVNHGACF